VDRIEPTRRRDRLDAIPRIVPGDRPRRGREDHEDEAPSEHSERDDVLDRGELPDDDDGRPHVDVRA
jgi:hypothetical protein